MCVVFQNCKIKEYCFYHHSKSTAVAIFNRLYYFVTTVEHLKLYPVKMITMYDNKAR